MMLFAGISVLPIGNQLPLGATSPTTAKPMADIDVFEEIRLGWNLGNSMDALGGETGWGNPVTTQAMIDKVAEKCNYLRLPVTWFEHTGPAPDYRIDPARLRRVKEIVDYAYKAKMYVGINFMHENSWLKPQTLGLDG
jgi:endoglucanase